MPTFSASVEATCDFDNAFAIVRVCLVVVLLSKVV